MSEIIINIAKDFSRFPAGRLRSDGKFSAEAFRDDKLLPELRNLSVTKMIIELDGVVGYSSSFLEETFGGLVRKGFSKEDINKRVHLDSANKLLIQEIKQYISEA